MAQERDLKSVQQVGEIQEESSAEVREKRSQELCGVPEVPPSFYHCARCNEDVLAQDVVWESEDEPHCPKCDYILKPRSDGR